MEQTRLLVLLRRAWQTLKAMPWSCTHQSPPVAAAPLTVTADTPSQLDKVAEERVLAAQMPAAISQQSQCDLLNEDEQLELEQLAALEVAVQLEAEAKLEETMQPEEVSPLQLDETLLTELDAAPVQTAAIEAIAKEDISEIGTAPTAEFGDPAVVTDNRPWQFPSLELLESSTHSAADSKLGYTQDELRNLSRLVESKLLDFGVKAQVVGAQPGPVITRFELELSAGTKVSKITGLAKDLARSLSVLSVRVVEVIPGKSVIGVELPNRYREIVRLRELLVAHEFQESRCKLALALGKGIAGEPVIVDLTKMPHLLVAGTTGSGKSVCINALLLSLLYKYTPDQLRLILIDPKMLELSVYSGIPHLLAPVIVDMKEATGVFRWCVAEMEHRYRLMAALGVRNLSGFNDYLQAAQERHEVVANPLWDGEGSLEPRELQPLPYLVVIADEYADMLMVVGKKIEELIARLAQKARAAGIHLILATQRPSVDVVTGLIKANIPTRIAFQVSSRIDSRTILDQSGAEQLLGAGDMLYLPIGSGVPIRVHGAFVDDNEVHRVVNAMKAVVAASLVDHSASTHGVSPNHMLGASSTTNSSSHYPMLDPQQLQQEEEREQLLLDGAGHGGGSRGCNSDDNEHDELYDQAVDWVLSNQRVSISSLQRRFRIGYNRAARIVESMEAAGLVGAMEGSGGTRRVLVQRESTATAEE